MRVLIAINETDYSEAIARFVKNHIWNEATKFKIISVVEPFPIRAVRDLLQGPILDEVRHEQTEFAEQLIENFTRSLSESIDRSRISKVIVEGIPIDAIYKELRSFNPSVLIVGSHTRQGLDRVLLGSVSHFLVSHAPCSVVVIRLATEST